MLRAAQFLHTRNGECGRTEPLDVGADVVEKLAKIHHLRFARGLFDHRDALGQRRRHHGIGRAQNRGSRAAAQ